MKQSSFFLVLMVFLSFNFAHATVGTVEWAARNSKIICGGTVDDVDLNFRVVVPNELLAAESDNGRFLLYADLHKPGQVRFVFNDALTDEDSAKRDALLAKLSPEDAALVRMMTMNRQSDLYMGLTDGFVLMQSDFGTHHLSIGCQEIQNPNNSILQ